jgi:hypothetical protein
MKQTHASQIGFGENSIQSGLWSARCRVPVLLFVALAVAVLKSVRAEQPRAAVWPELSAVTEPLQRFVCRGTIQCSRDSGKGPSELAQPQFPFPDNVSLVASEGNTNFVYACGSVCSAPPSPGDTGGHTSPTWMRRFFYFQSGIIVVDDFVPGIASSPSFERVLNLNVQASIENACVRATRAGEEFVSEMVWPPLDKAAAIETNSLSGAHFIFRPKADAAPAGRRLVHVLHVEPRVASASKTIWSRVFEAVGMISSSPHVRTRATLNETGELAVVVSTTNRVVHLVLPASPAGPGWVAIDDAQGGCIVRKRLLPSGNLPRGDLVDQWDSCFGAGARRNGTKGRRP